MWVIETKKADKQIKKLPKGVQSWLKPSLFNLIRELRLLGSHRTNWSNFGKLSGVKGIKIGKNQTAYHCHLKKGNPTYVVVWIAEQYTAKHIKELKKELENENRRSYNKEEKEVAKGTISIIYVGTHEKAPY